MAPVCSIEVGPPAPKGEGRARRHYKSVDKLVASPDPSCVNNMWDIFQRSARLWPDKNGMGYRETIKIHNEEKEVVKVIKGKEATEVKKWTYYEMSDFKFYTYKQLAGFVKDIASGLVELGITSTDRLNIYSSTRMTWQLLAHACASQGIVFATSYDTLGEEGLAHSINQPEAVAIFTNANLLGTLANVIARTPSLEYIIYDDDCENQSVLDQLKQSREGLRIITYDELKKLGAEHPHEPNPPKSSDLAAIVYTSGSSGTPKGVQLLHLNLISAVASTMVNVGDVLPPDSRYIAYLPLAHVLELAAELSVLFLGITIGYGQIKTLTDTSMRNCLGDMRAFRPTVMAGVPAVWELIRKGIETKVRAGGGVKEKVFNGAVAAKRTSRILFGGITDAVVFNKVKEATGGHLKVAMSGGAGISKETQEFLDLAVVTIMGGYGLTETVGMATVTHPNYYLVGAAGCPMPANELKLVDYPEAGYYSSNNPPQGEVYIRGNSVTPGYFKDEQTTKEALTADGWFMTGDIGQWNPNGTLSLIDRKKNLVKLSNGEYIAIERLESVYRSCRLVANICVVADPLASKPAAILFPHEVNLRAYVAEKNLGDKHDDLKAYCADEKIRDATLAELNAVGKRAGFKPLELLQAVVLTPEEWTAHNGLLTAAQKLQRKAIMEMYGDQVKAVYP